MPYNCFDLKELTNSVLSSYHWYRTCQHALYTGVAYWSTGVFGATQVLVSPFKMFLGTRKEGGGVSY